MRSCVSLLSFTISVLCLPGVVRGQSCNKMYSKLSDNLVDELYFQLCKTDSAHTRLRCAMRCSLGESCTLFQFKNGQCELFKQESGPGIDIISGPPEIGMTAVWTSYIGKTTIMLGLIRERGMKEYLSKPFMKFINKG